MPETHPASAAELLRAHKASEQRDCVELALGRARRVQEVWAKTELAKRLQCVRKLRSLIAENSEWLATETAKSRPRPTAEILTAEVLPLAEACQFLEANAYWILSQASAPKAGRPIWMSRITTTIVRQPLGVVLVIGPSNYPLFLAAVQALQAVTAGNGVLIKPAPGSEPAANAFLELLEQAGFPRGLVAILPSDKAAAIEAISCGVDKVFLTGSRDTGRAVYAECAKAMVPAVMELSGCDAVIVAEDADLSLAVRGVAFALRLNDGATCISPRRLLVHSQVANEFEKLLVEELSAGRRIEISGRVAVQLKSLLTEAVTSGARLCLGQTNADGAIVGPVVVADAQQKMRLLNEDVFAPLISLVTVADDAEAIRLANDCEYQLGASVFSRDSVRARRIANALRAGCVTINDLVAPTADPRVPFGGTGASGFGTTRGAAGLLEMTRPKAVIEHAGSFRPHFDPAQPGDAGLFAAFTRLLHVQGLRNRGRALVELVRAGRLRGKAGSEPNSDPSKRKQP